jgi:hypothetical protein
MLHQGTKETPLLINGIMLPALTGLSSTSRLEASVDLNTSALSISITNTTSKATTEVFTSSVAVNHIQKESRSLHQALPPATAHVATLLGGSMHAHINKIKVSCGQSNGLLGIDLNIAGHLEHCVQLNNLAVATDGKSVAAFSSMHANRVMKSNAPINIITPDGIEFGAGGMLHLAGVQYKSTHKTKMAAQEPSRKTFAELKYTTVWQAHQSMFLQSDIILQGLEGLEVSAGPIHKQQFANNSVGANSLLEFAQKLALLQSCCELYPKISNLNVKSSSTRASFYNAPAPGRKNCAAGTVAAALRCVVNERSEMKGSALFNSQYQPIWNHKGGSASTDPFGVELAGGVELVPRLLPAAAPLLKSNLLAPIAKSWAISGGNGALGQLFSDWLCQQGTSRQILLCRSGRFNGDSVPRGLFDSTSQGMVTVHQ